MEHVFHRNNVVNIGSVPKPVHTAYVIHTYLRCSTNVCLSPDPEGMCAAKYAVMGIFSQFSENSPLGIFQETIFIFVPFFSAFSVSPEPSWELTVKAGTTSYLIWPWKGKQCTLFTDSLWGMAFWLFYYYRLFDKVR